jgi:putative restriction endonuclease
LKAVFDTRRGHFTTTTWRSGINGSLAYFAVARVANIVPDPLDLSHGYAMMTDYLPFDSLVPFRTVADTRKEYSGALPKASDVGVSLRGRSIRGFRIHRSEGT